MVNIKFVFAWYDIWIGLFIDKPKRRIYIFPFPCFGLMVEWKSKPAMNQMVLRFGQWICKCNCHRLVGPNGEKTVACQTCAANHPGTAMFEHYVVNGGIHKQVCKCETPQRAIGHKNCLRCNMPLNGV